jgi:hypothetical protein
MTDRATRGRRFAIAFLLLASACTGSGNGKGSLISTSPLRPSGSPTPNPSATIPTGEPPIVLIILENKAYSVVVGSPAAPYLNGTLIPSGKLFTNYSAVSHPSLPNYLALTSGSTQGKDGTDDISAGEITADNLFHQLASAGISWDAYQEAMPGSCFTGDFAGSSPNTYALKHDPAMAYQNIASGALCRHVTPYDQLDPSSLPAFSFVTPNQCHDMHSCSISTGDTWLEGAVPPLLGAGAEVIITFDEGTGSSQTIMTLVVGPGVAPGKDGARYDHYGLLAGLEIHFGLVRLGKARQAVPLPV